MAARSTPQPPVRRVAAAWLLATTVALVAPAVPAQAWSDGACPDADAGVTVVVDFRGFRDEVVVRCAPAPVESGFDALRTVGLEPTATQRHPGFLCRIDGLPADDPCVNTPPSDAYWAYWRAEPGGSWQYSQYGPGTTSPPPGPVEGWRFSTGDDAPPRVPPPGTAAADPSPTPTSTSSPTPTSPSPSPTPRPSPPATTSPPPAPATHGPTHTPAPSTAPTPEPSATTSTPTPTPDATPTTPPATPSATPTSPTASEDLAPAAAPAAAPAEDDGGPPLGTLAGVALVVFVGGGAVLADRRRRRP